MNPIRPKQFITLYVLLMTLAITVNAQEQVLSRSSEIAKYYDVIYGADQRLISGAYYYDPPRGSIDGDPYYYGNDWKKGAISVGGIEYDNLDLKYDIERNMIVVKYTTIYNSTYQIAINNDNVEYFYINETLFKPYPGTNVHDESRFCEVMADGKLSYLVLKIKTLSLTNDARMNNYNYTTKVKQFIVYNSELINFRTRKNLYRLVPEYKSEIRRYKRSEGLSLMKKTIEDRSEIINYCNTLTGN